MDINLCINKKKVLEPKNYDMARQFIQQSACSGCFIFIRGNNLLQNNEKNFGGCCEGNEGNILRRRIWIKT